MEKMQAVKSFKDGLSKKLRASKKEAWTKDEVLTFINEYYITFLESSFEKEG